MEKSGRMRMRKLVHNLIEFSRLRPNTYCPFIFKCNPLLFKWVTLSILELSIKLKLKSVQKVIRMLFTSIPFFIQMVIARNNPRNHNFIFF